MLEPHGLYVNALALKLHQIVLFKNIDIDGLEPYLFNEKYPECFLLPLQERNEIIEQD